MNFIELNEKIKTMGLVEPRMIDKTNDPIGTRKKLFSYLQTSLTSFSSFFEEFFKLVNKVTPCFIQRDIALQLELNDDIFFSAQRSTGKTQLIIPYIIYNIIKNPSLIVMFISSTGKVSKNVFNAVTDAFMKIPALMCLYPTGNGGTAGFDSGFSIHSDIRGAGTKDPSLRCTTTDSKNTGSRAHLMIFDDFEVPETCTTIGKIEALNERHDTLLPYLVNLENEDGKTIFKSQRVYIGTPQHTQSMYFTKLSNIRKFVYPGRLPNEQQLQQDAYCGSLAPVILSLCKQHPEKMSGYGLHGNLGENIYFSDSHRLGEEFQLKMESQSNRYKLDYLLDPSQNQTSIKPLKLEYINFCMFTTDRFPINFSSGIDPLELPPNFPLRKKLYASTSTEYASKPTQIVMAIDPAGMGGSGDETAYAVGFASGPFVYILECGGIRITETTAESNFERLANIAKKYGVHTIYIEENFGSGFVSHSMRPIIQAIHSCDIKSHKVQNNMSKEKRILYNLEPLFHSKRIVFNEDILFKDNNSIQEYSSNERQHFSLFFQLINMTNEKGALKHDDRIDALSNLCSFLTPQVHSTTDGYTILPKYREQNMESGMMFAFE